MNNNFVFWVDLETTGTDENEDRILEVGAVITGPAPNYLVVSEFSSVTNELSPARLWRMDDTVTQMHARSGLLSEAKRGGREIAEIDAALAREINTLTKGEHMPIGGSGVSHFDRRFIRRYMPKVDKRVSYWAYDVGVLRRALRQAGFAIPKDDNLNHRALDDIRDHIEEMRTYMLALDELRHAQLNHSASECAEGGYCPAHQIIAEAA